MKNVTVIIMNKKICFKQLLNFFVTLVAVISKRIGRVVYYTYSLCTFVHITAARSHGPCSPRKNCTPIYLYMRDAPVNTGKSRLYRNSYKYTQPSASPEQCNNSAEGGRRRQRQGGVNKGWRGAQEGGHGVGGGDTLSARRFRLQHPRGKARQQCSRPHCEPDVPPRGGVHSPTRSFRRVSVQVPRASNETNRDTAVGDLVSGLAVAAPALVLLTAVERWWWWCAAQRSHRNNRHTCGAVGRVFITFRYYPFRKQQKRRGDRDRPRKTDRVSSKVETECFGESRFLN